MKQSDCLVTSGTMPQHGIALINPNSIQGVSILKVVCLNSGFLQGKIMTLFCCSFDPEKTLCFGFILMWYNK